MSGGTEFKDAVPTYRKLTFQHEPPLPIIEADIRRACKAAPDRTIGDRVPGRDNHSAATGRTSWACQAESCGETGDQVLNDPCAVPSRPRVA